MKIIYTKFEGLKIYKKKKHTDKRGYLIEIYNEDFVKTKSFLEIVTKSKKNVLRGLHFQKKFQQIKFISVLKGEIIDISVDLRVKSKTFGKFFKIKLSEKNCFSLLIPKGFAHGYYSTAEESLVHYKCSTKRYPKDEYSLDFFDKKLKIKLPFTQKINLSDRDKNSMTFSDFQKKIRTL